MCWCGVDGVVENEVCGKSNGVILLVLSGVGAVLNDSPSPGDVVVV